MSSPYWPTPLLSTAYMYIYYIIGMRYTIPLSWQSDNQTTDCGNDLYLLVVPSDHGSYIKETSNLCSGIMVAIVMAGG